MPGRESASLGDAFLEALAQRIAEEVARQVVPLLARLSAPKVAYNVQEAAKEVGLSTTAIRAAIRTGHLVAKYPTSRPLILAEDLAAWVGSAPS